MKFKSFQTALLLAGALMLTQNQARAEKAEAKIRGTAPNSKIEGTVTLEDSDQGLKVTAHLMNVPPGAHGFHIHEYGACDDMGKAAGGHYNPMGHPHGDAVKGAMSAHAGDMGNITADSNGHAMLSVVLPNVKLTKGQAPVAGRAIVLHEKADDFSQPVGNAGARIGCAPIVIVSSQPQAAPTPAPAQTTPKK